MKKPTTSVMVHFETGAEFDPKVVARRDSEGREYRVLKIGDLDIFLSVPQLGQLSTVVATQVEVS